MDTTIPTNVDTICYVDYIHERDRAYIVVDRATGKTVRSFAYQERAEAFAKSANQKARTAIYWHGKVGPNVYKNINVSHIEVW